MDKEILSRCGIQCLVSAPPQTIWHSTGGPDSSLAWKSSETSLPRGCLLPLPSCWPPMRGSLGVLEALTWRGPFVRKFSLAFPYSSTSCGFHALSPHLGPGTGLGTQEPGISLSIASCSSLGAGATPVLPTVRQSVLNKKHLSNFHF